MKPKKIGQISCPHLSILLEKKRLPVENMGKYFLKMKFHGTALVSRTPRTALHIPNRLLMLPSLTCQILYWQVWVMLSIDVTYRVVDLKHVWKATCRNTRENMNWISSGSRTENRKNNAICGTRLEYCFNFTFWSGYKQIASLFHW